MTVSDQQGFWPRFAKEPLVHFLLLAGALFVAQALFAKDERDVITVDAQTQTFLFEKEEQLVLRPLSEQEKASIVENFIEEEILVREAMKRGFSDSGRVRALLLQNMRFFISGDIPEPTDEDLRAYFDTNADTFTSPPSFDLEQVMYAAGDVPADDVLQQLNNGADPETLGAPGFAMGRIVRFMTQRRIAQAFGADETSKVLAAIADSDAWQGPFTSTAGSVHFIRVLQRNAPQLPEFEVAKDWVGTQWIADQSRAAIDREIESVIDGYVIEVEPTGGAAPGA